MRAFFAARKDWRGIWFNCDDLEVRVLLFEHFPNACDRAAGAYTGDQDIYLTVGIAPDFFCRGVAVNFRIGRVFELLQNQVVRVGCG